MPGAIMWTLTSKRILENMICSKCWSRHNNVYKSQLFLMCWSHVEDNNGWGRIIKQKKCSRDPQEKAKGADLK